MQRHKGYKREHEGTIYIYIYIYLISDSRMFKKEVAGNESGQSGMAHRVCFAKELGLGLIG